MRAPRRTLTALALGLGALVAIPAVVVAGPTAVQPSIVSANPLDTTPFVKDGRADALARIGDRIYVAGSFTQVKNFQGSAPTQTRRYLFAYSATTGRIDEAFNPVINAPVMTIAAAPDGMLLVGGQFSSVNGVARTGLVKLDAATGATVAAFKGTTGGGWVTDIDVANGKVYLTGTFTKIRSVARARLGAVDAMTGALDADLNLALTAQNPSTGARVYQAEHRLDVSPDGSRLVLAGNFGQVGGLARTQLAMVDLTTSPDTVADWSSDRYPFYNGLKTNVNDVEIDPTGTYAVVVAGFPPRWSGTTPIALGDHAARFEIAATGTVAPTWFVSSPTDTFTSVAISGSAVYVGGHFKWLGGQTSSVHTGAVLRAGLAALDPTNGVPMNWNPGRDRGWGVIDMLVTDTQLVIAHDTNVVAGEWHPRLAAFPLNGGSTPPTPAVPQLPARLVALPTDDAVASTMVDFDGAALATPVAGPAGSWSWVRGAFTNGTDLYAGSSDGTLYRMTWDGTTWANPVDISTRADYAAGPALNYANVAAMAYDGTGLFIAQAGSPVLTWRGFNLESGLPAGYGWGVSGIGDGADWSTVRSLAMIGSTLYSTWADGTLVAVPVSGRSVDWAARSVVSGPAVDGVDWSAVEMVAMAA